MIYLMSAFELSPGDVRLLKFENIAMKNKQATISIFKLKSNSKQRIPISDSLYKKIMKYQKDLTKNNKKFMANKSTKTETIVGNFLFKDFLLHLTYWNQLEIRHWNFNQYVWIYLTCFLLLLLE